MNYLIAGLLSKNEFYNQGGNSWNQGKRVLYQGQMMSEY